MPADSLTTLHLFLRGIPLALILQILQGPVAELSTRANSAQESSAQKLHCNAMNRPAMQRSKMPLMGRWGKERVLRWMKSQARVQNLKRSCWAVAPVTWFSGAPLNCTCTEKKSTVERRMSGESRGQSSSSGGKQARIPVRSAEKSLSTIYHLGHTTDSIQPWAWWLSKTKARL